jgi:hypothetical protein
LNDTVLARRLALGTATMASAASLFLVPTSSPAAAAAPTPGSRLHIVGGPVSAEGAAVIITVDSSHNLHLNGIAPDTGKVLWSHPYSESAITQGEAPTVYAIGNNVIDMVPAAKPNSPLVNIEGVNATTGSTAWKSLLRGVVVSDQPSSCAGKVDLCVIGFNQDGSTTMAILNPATGAPILTLNGPFRSLDSDIYQTNAKDPLIERLSPFGKISWSKPLSALMGATGYAPDFGWDLEAYGQTEVGTFGSASALTDHSFGLDRAKTIGVSLADGSVTWTAPGEYQCGGTLQIVTQPLLCVFHGTLASTKVNTKTLFNSYKGLNVVLEGLTVATGATTWTLPVKNVSAIANGKIEISDGSHLLVQLKSGKSALLDTSTGTTAPVRKGQIFWCASTVEFKVNENKSVNTIQKRVAGTTFFPCTEKGKETTKLPSSSPSTVGVTIDGVFLWSSPHGLSSRIVGSARGVA